jgi:DDE superfamily endonuclease
VAADIGYGDNALFRQQLTDAGWQYAVAVKGGTAARDGDAAPQARPCGGLGQPPKAACLAPPASLRTLAIAHADQGHPVTWRQGTRTSKDNPGAAMASWFLAIRVRPAGKPVPRPAGRSLPACWLLAGWPPGAGEPSGYWLSTLPQDIPLGELVRLAKIRWRVEHDYRELKTGLPTQKPVRRDESLPGSCANCRSSWPSSSASAPCAASPSHSTGSPPPSPRPNQVLLERRSSTRAWVRCAGFARNIRAARNIWGTIIHRNFRIARNIRDKRMRSRLARYPG